MKSPFAKRKKRYMVFFKIFDKKLKVSIEANDRTDIKEILEHGIKIIDIKELTFDRAAIDEVE